MLDSLTLESFRCFETLKLPLRRLTLLTGFNGAGKSTVMQALFALKQTIVQDSRASRLLLNGPEVALGTFNRVVHDLKESTHFIIGISNAEGNVSWRFEGDRDDVSAEVSVITLDGVEYSNVEDFDRLLPSEEASAKQREIMSALAAASYLTSERPTPEAVHRLERPHSQSSVGRNGKYAVGLLHTHRDHIVEAPLQHSSVTSPRLLAQVEAWMRELFPGFRIQVRHMPDSNLVVLGIRLSDETDFHEPAHTGYGLTQVLPVIVAALIAKPGNILAIENPENDLHPTGQAFVGSFLCRVAACGVQVLVETHSDHVLNGVRRSIKDALLDSGDVLVHFLRPSSDHEASINTLEIDANGKIATWPAGFFDQLDADLEYFAGWDS